MCANVAAVLRPKQEVPSARTRDLYWHWRTHLGLTVFAVFDFRRRLRLSGGCGLRCRPNASCSSAASCIVIRFQGRAEFARPRLGQATRSSVPVASNTSGICSHVCAADVISIAPDVCSPRSAFLRVRLGSRAVSSTLFRRRGWLDMASTMITDQYRDRRCPLLPICRLLICAPYCG